MTFYNFKNNKKISQILKKNIKDILLTGNKFKARAYSKALESLEFNQKTDITLDNVDSLIKFKSVGKSAIKIIKKILNGEDIDMLTEEQRQKVTSLENLTTLYGVGLSAANKWLDMGINNLEDLREEFTAGNVKLTSAQKLGLEHYEDLHTRIPQKEIDSLGKILINLSKQVDPTMEVILAGSYRRYMNLPKKIRNKKTSGDIDILIIHPELVTKEQVKSSSILKDLYKKLNKLPEHYGKLALGSTKYSGLVAFESCPVRHLDIRLFPAESKIPSILHFTGSGMFNQQIRAHALSLGYTLSEYHLKHLESGKIVSLNCEEDIFTELGLDYVSPEKRDL